MIGLHVTVPAACFRKGLAREYLETEALPPPSTCYGFLLSMVGEVDRHRHLGSRIAPALLGKPDISVVLRTVWRVKQTPLGSSGNTRPDYQQLLTGIELIIWLDSSDEPSGRETLEARVRLVLDPKHRGSINRFGGLSLGESTHLVDEVAMLTEHRAHAIEDRMKEGLTHLVFTEHPKGRLTLPVWVDHVGATGTVYVVGDLEQSTSLQAPDRVRMPQIRQQRRVPVA